VTALSVAFPRPPPPLRLAAIVFGLAISWPTAPSGMTSAAAARVVAARDTAGALREQLTAADVASELVASSYWFKQLI
jgi:hypothetical protein